MLRCAPSLLLAGLFGMLAAASATATAPATAQAKPALASFEPDSLAQIVKAHQGKPFVLLLWSLDCPFCQLSLAALSRKKTSAARLDVVTLTTDAQGDAEIDAQVSARLRALGLTRNAWAYGAAPPEQLRYAIDPKWHGELPRSYWFDAHGKRVGYSGVLTPEIIRKLAGQ